MSPESQPSSDRRGGLDEWVAVVVALVSVGGVMVWGLGRHYDDLLAIAPGESLVVMPAEEIVIGAAVGAAADEDSPRAGVQRPPSPTRLPTTSTSNRTGMAIAHWHGARSRQDWSMGSAVRSVPLAATVAAIAFVDVPDTYWAKPFIDQMAQRGLIEPLSGQTFQPEQPMSRAEYAALLYAALPQQERQVAPSFVDLPETYWALDAIEASVKSGFLTGLDGDEFRPDENLTRVQLFQSLNRGLSLDPSTRPLDEVLGIYGDRNQIPESAVPAVAAVTEAGLVVGDPETLALEPDRPATRAEVVSMVYQALVLKGEAQPIESPYSIQP
ncbi:MAG: S-layer homology domain-containing protein [Leptolyngbya sp. DLM2.Bin15]|nr:MAG: S-layer homology domain-containing protein [Leptolyngbya sp. DLM2.Bin15]